MNEEALDFTESRGGEEEGWRWPGERKMRGGREKAREEGRAPPRCPPPPLNVGGTDLQQREKTRGRSGYTLIMACISVTQTSCRRRQSSTRLMSTSSTLKGRVTPGNTWSHLVALLVTADHTWPHHCFYSHKPLSQVLRYKYAPELAVESHKLEHVPQRLVRWAGQQHAGPL